MAFLRMGSGGLRSKAVSSVLESLFKGYSGLFNFIQPCEITDTGLSPLVTHHSSNATTFHLCALCAN
jgi:hypothetical protein